MSEKEKKNQEEERLRNSQEGRSQPEEVLQAVSDASAKSCKMNEVQPEGLAKCTSVVILPNSFRGER